MKKLGQILSIILFSTIVMTITLTFAVAIINGIKMLFEYFLYI